LSLLGTALLWAGLWIQLTSNRRRAALAVAALGFLFVFVAGGGFDVSGAWPLLGSLVLLSAFGLHWVIAHRPRTAAVSPVPRA
jgi:hypothetical protein